MRTKYILLLFVSALLLFQFAISTTNASADPTVKMTGQTIDGRWLGSFNTKAPTHSFCIDGFRWYPRSSYNWKMTQVRSPEVAYSLWRFGQDPNTTQATALSWYVHATDKIGHNNAPGYRDLPKSSLPPGVEATVDIIRGQAFQNAGPYRLILSMQNSVKENQFADGSVRLVGGRGQTISDGFNNRQIKVTLESGRFGTGQASKTFGLANGRADFQYRRANGSTNVIRAAASISYAPIQVRRYTSNVKSVQRVVSFMGGDSFSDNNSTRVNNVAAPAEDTAEIRLLKHGQGNLPPSYRLEGAVFAINRSVSPPGPNADRETTNINGVLVFRDLEINTDYYLHEVVAPAGHNEPTSGNPIPVTTGGNNSQVEARNGNPVINTQTLFDLALRKYIHAVNDQATGQNGTGTPQPTEVKVGDVVQHRIVVFNQNETAGWAEQVVDYIPEGYDFVPELNQDWTFDENNRTAIRNTSEFRLGADPTPDNIDGNEPQFSVDIYLRVNSRLYTSTTGQAGVNFAEICTDGNNFDYPDIDSTPDCDQANDIVGGDNIINNNNSDEDDQDYNEIIPQDIPASTEATKFSEVGGEITDTLTTEITMPEGLAVIFDVYSEDQCVTPVYSSSAIATTEGVNQVTDPIGYQPTNPGSYYWIARIVNPLDQREYFRGECGDPNEISQVYRITTLATNSVQLGSEIRDIARVEGELPAGSNIRFNLYAPGDNQCGQSPVYVSDLIPTEAGKTEYTSDLVLTKEVGVYRWVAELVEQDQLTVLARGICGIANENSHVWNISTMALKRIYLGGTVYDIAIVSGSIPDKSKVRFKLYEAEDSNCENPIFVSNTQGVDGPGYYQSNNYKPEKTGDYYWVEELLDEDNQIIAKGVCGLENETSTVLAKDARNIKEDEDPNNPNNPRGEAPPVSIVEKSIPVTG